jgi:nucleoside-diphosphate-sugar epimerase
MKKTLVVGGSGFIGKAVQRYVLERGLADSFTFTYCRGRENILPGVEAFEMDLLENIDIGDIRPFSGAIYLAGNANHGLAKRDPLMDLRLNAEAFIKFVGFFKGSVALLTSQAVYYGLDGEIGEDVDHMPGIPYGISKKVIEAYAHYFLNEKMIHNLYIFRLMYSFGEGEKERRLISACARAARSGGRVEIYGGGKSYLNPLPSSFVAEVLIAAIEDLYGENKGFAEAVNLNHPERITVADAVNFLKSIRGFDCAINDWGEEWPVTFWGRTERLHLLLKEWGLSLPDPWDSLKKHYLRETADGLR